MFLMAPCGQISYYLPGYLSRADIYVADEQVRSDVVQPLKDQKVDYSQEQNTNGGEHEDGGSVAFPTVMMATLALQGGPPSSIPPAMCHLRSSTSTSTCVLFWVPGCSTQHLTRLSSCRVQEFSVLHALLWPSSALRKCLRTTGVPCSVRGGVSTGVHIVLLTALLSAARVTLNWQLQLRR
jgi:hypothetical protein